MRELGSSQVWETKHTAGIFNKTHDKNWYLEARNELDHLGCPLCLMGFRFDFRGGSAILYIYTFIIVCFTEDIDVRIYYSFKIAYAK